jgi:hypothetical protein
MVLVSQKNLLEAGSGRLAGGTDAAQCVSKTASSLKVSGITAIGLMLLIHRNALSSLTNLEIKHNNKRKRSMLILLGKS